MAHSRAMPWRVSHVDRASSWSARASGSWVVDLVRQAGRELAERDEGLALSRRRLDGSRGAVQPFDEVPAEREPVVEPVAEHLGRHPQHPPGRHGTGGGKVDAVLVKGAESAGPLARHVPPPHHGVLKADVAHEVYRPVNEHPSVVRELTLAEQVHAGLEADLGAARDQIGELVTGQALEEADTAKIVNEHQVER